MDLIKSKKYPHYTKGNWKHTYALEEEMLCIYLSNKIQVNNTLCVQKKLKWKLNSKCIMVKSILRFKPFAPSH